MIALMLDKQVSLCYHGSMLQTSCGHETKRVIKTLCEACYAKDWRERHPGQANANAKRFREAHPDRVLASTNKWRDANPDKVREYQRRADAKRDRGIANKDMWRYKSTAEEYERLYYSQLGVCAICELPDRFRLSVDHDHNTGKIRGLLCRKCNSGIGLLKDSYELIMKAAHYIKGAEVTT